MEFGVLDAEIFPWAKRKKKGGLFSNSGGGRAPGEAMTHGGVPKQERKDKEKEDDHRERERGPLANRGQASHILLVTPSIFLGQFSTPPSSLSRNRSSPYCWAVGAFGLSTGPPPPPLFDLGPGPGHPPSAVTGMTPQGTDDGRLGGNRQRRRGAGGVRRRNQGPPGPGGKGGWHREEARGGNHLLLSPTRPENAPTPQHAQTYAVEPPPVLGAWGFLFFFAQSKSFPNPTPPPLVFFGRKRVALYPGPHLPHLAFLPFLPPCLPSLSNVYDFPFLFLLKE